MSVPANLDLPPPLLSRFDLLYLLLDKVDEDADRRLAQHLVALYMDDNVVTGGINILVSEIIPACSKALIRRVGVYWSTGIDSYLMIKKNGLFFRTI